MSSSVTRAYGATREALGPRALEADVFRRVVGGLRGAGGPISVARAVADNRRLWMAVEGALSDPTNALPAELRANFVSIGRAVLREMDEEAPDLGFLIAVNENVAAGLASN